MNKLKQALRGSRGQSVDISTLNQDQLKVGIAVQMQHTDNKDIATSIAVDHLVQHDDYYTKLIKAGLVDETNALSLAKRLGILQFKKKDVPKTKKQEPKKKQSQQKNVKQSRGSKIKRSLLLKQIAGLVHAEMQEQKHSLKESWNNVLAMYKYFQLTQTEKQKVATMIGVEFPKELLS